MADIHLVSDSAGFKKLRQLGYFYLYLLGHHWLDEKGQPLFELDSDSLLDVRETFFFDKEYASLEKKPEYASQLNHEVLQSRLHELQSLTDKKLHMPKV